MSSAPPGTLCARRCYGTRTPAVMPTSWGATISASFGSRAQHLAMCASRYSASMLIFATHWQAWLSGKVPAMSPMKSLRQPPISWSTAHGQTSPHRQWSSRLRTRPRRSSTSPSFGSACASELELVPVRSGPGLCSNSWSLGETMVPAVWNIAPFTEAWFGPEKDYHQDEWSE